MDENAQKPLELTGNKSSGFVTSAVVALLFFIIGALISGAIVFWSQKQMLKAAAAEVKKCEEFKTDYDKTKFDNSKSEINWKDKLLLSKDYSKFMIGAYNATDLLEEVFIVAPIDNGIPTTYRYAYALSFASDIFMMDNLFDIVGEKIYILNQNEGFIEIYTASFTEETLATSAFYRMNHIDSINGPKYKVGVPYSIKCQNNLCQIETAFHQESGCSMELNLETKQYSKIKCSSMGGDFNPEPL